MGKNPIHIENGLESIRQAVSEGNRDTAISLLESLRRSDQADVFSELPRLMTTVTDNPGHFFYLGLALMLIAFLVWRR